MGDECADPKLLGQLDQILLDDVVGAGIRDAPVAQQQRFGLGVVEPQVLRSTPRKLGILQGKGKAIFADDFKMTEEEFLGQ